MKFKAGDRVRIRYDGYVLDGREATILGRGNGWGRAASFYGESPGWRLNVDNHGTKSLSLPGAVLTLPERHLEPIIPLGSWGEIANMVGKDIRKPVKIES